MPLSMAAMVPPDVAVLPFDEPIDIVTAAIAWSRANRNPALGADDPFRGTQPDSTKMQPIAEWP